jgi:glutamine synthetase
MGIGTLPGSLSEALSELDKDTVLKNALGDKVYDVFYRTKYAEAENYRLNVTGWEIEKYLETA